MTESVAPELIAVRTDERFDEAALHSYLRDRLEGGELPLHVEQFAGGHANLTYLLRYGESGGEGGRVIEYVLRRPPLGPVAPGSHDMNREYRALSVLWEAFPPAPRAFLYCDDAGVIGAPFFVMERRRGIVIRGSIPAEFGGGADPRANRKLSEVVIDTLAEFHGVDAHAIGLESLGRDPERFLERQVKGWTDRYERAKTGTIEVADELARWLLDNLPVSPAPTLLHNDWRLDNMAVDPEDPGRCAAVYDWDMCTVGDPLADLGTLLALWNNRGDAPAGMSPMPTQSLGFLSREEAVARYGERSGRDLGGVAYYDVFGTFKMAVVLQQIYFRYHRGQTQDERFAGLGAGAAALFERAASRRPR
jgi:aminoglycoside phosphotransferase (APT) family kinase protein